MLLFSSDRGGWPMTRIDFGFVRKDQQLGPDGLNDLLIGPAPQIGAPDTARKEGVTGKEFSGQTKANTAWRVARGVKNLSRDRAGLHHIPFLKPMLNRDGLRCFETKHGYLLGQVLIEKQILFV